MVLTEQSSIRSYWIGHYDGGALVPNLVWYTGASPSVTVLPATLTASRGFVCTDFQMGTPYAVALLLDYQHERKQKLGEIRFSQDNESELYVTLESDTLPLGEYLINIDVFGDLSRGCVFDIKKLSDIHQNATMPINFNGSRNVTMLRNCHSLFGARSIVGHSVVLSDKENRVLGCGVIGIGKKSQMSTGLEGEVGNSVRQNQQSGTGSTNPQGATSQQSGNISEAMNATRAQEGIMGDSRNTSQGTNQHGIIQQGTTIEQLNTTEQGTNQASTSEQSGSYQQESTKQQSNMTEPVINQESTNQQSNMTEPVINQGSTSEQSSSNQQGSTNQQSSNEQGSSSITKSDYQ